MEEKIWDEQVFKFLRSLEGVNEDSSYNVLYKGERIVHINLRDLTLLTMKVDAKLATVYDFAHRNMPRTRRLPINETILKSICVGSLSMTRRVYEEEITQILNNR